jgi:uncharacterized protein
MELIQLIIKGISYSQVQTGAYALILQETKRNKKLPIIIGSLEAQSIAMALEKGIKFARPLTHDLFLSMAKEFNIKVSRVMIYKLQEGVFYSNIVLTQSDSTKETFIDSRTSDAIAIAIRFDAPIFTSNEIMNKAAIEIEELEEIATQEKLEINSIFYDQSIEDLEDQIFLALEEENYEIAALIRDEIEKRKLS